jgi:hypothetical protein
MHSIKPTNERMSDAISNIPINRMAAPRIAASTQTMMPKGAVRNKRARWRVPGSFQGGRFEGQRE